MFIDMLAIALIATGPVPQARSKPQAAPRVQPEARPAFSFRDWTTRDAYRPEDPRLSTCIPHASGHACYFKDKKIGGVAARQIGVAFGLKGLYALEAKFQSDDSPVVEAALRDRYGAPCEERVTRPSNMFGHRFENRIRVWCFSDGRATFRSIHKNSASEASFEFETFDAARQAAVRDF